MKYNLCLILILILSIVHSEKQRIIYFIKGGEIDINKKSVLTDIIYAHCKAAGDFIANNNITRFYFHPKIRQSAKLIANHYQYIAEFVDDYYSFPEKGNDYLLIERLKELLNYIWELEYEEKQYIQREYAIVCNDKIINILTSVFLKDLTTKEKMDFCAVSKIVMKSNNLLNIEYWNENSFFKEGELKYLKKPK